MTSLIRFMSWMAAIGNGKAALNAWRAVEDRVQAEAAVDALSARLAAAASLNAPSRAA
jgi:hypothetical protein